MQNRLVLLLLAIIALAPYVEAQSVYTEGQPQLRSGPIALPDFSDLVAEVGSAVVNISVEGEESKESVEIPGIPFQFKREGPLTSLGSGFIISADGYIVTNNHVVEKGGRVVARLLNDKTEYEAKIIGKDIKTDLALLKIEPARELKYVYFGDSEELSVGDWVMAIGNQFQLGQTVTAGIVSATSRKVPQGGPYDNFIQTDASINPGSSGGPLFNVNGQVVGINTAIFSPGKAQSGGAGFNIGIGFATPINLAKHVLVQLKQSGKVVRGWLGVLIQKIGPDEAYVFGLKKESGALVGHVLDGSPAATAGFQRGDIILTYNGQTIHENDDLPLMVANTPIGDSVPVEIIRDRKPMTLSVTIERLKEDAPKPAEPEVKSDEYGLTLDPLDSKLAELYGVSDTAGALVRSVKPNSVAERSGLNRGDLIRGVVMHGLGEQPVSNPAELYKLMKGAESGKPVSFLIYRLERQGATATTLYLTLKFR